MRFLVLTAALLLPVAPVFGLPTTEDRAPSVIPFELRHGHIFVQAYVNGRGPYLFGFDTGASGMGRADVRLTQELRLPKVGEEQNSDGIKTVRTDVVSVETLRLGAVEKHDLRLLSRNYNGSSAAPPFLMGIIGRDFFADRLLTIDYPHRTLTLSRGRLKADAPSVVAYGPGLVVPVCLGTRCYEGKIDTGSSAGLVVPKEAALEMAAGPANYMGNGRRTNSTAALYEVKLHAPITVAGLAVPPAPVVFADPSEEVASVGSEFLQNYVLTIDQRYRLLRITNPSR